MFAILKFGSSTKQNQYNTYDSWKTRVRSYPLACICHKLMAWDLFVKNEERERENLKKELAWVDVFRACAW